MRINHLLIAVSCLLAAAIVFSLPKAIVRNASAAEEPAAPLALPDHVGKKADRSDAASGGRIELAARDRQSDERSKEDRHGRRCDGSSALPLAQCLSALEVLIGIRADQLNAWRDYASALIDLLEPRCGLKQPGDRNGVELAPGAMKDPFDREQKLAAAVIRQATVAERLIDAITTLRAALTAEQLGRLATAGHSKQLRAPSDPFDKSGSRQHEHEAKGERDRSEDPEPHALQP